MAIRYLVNTKDSGLTTLDTFPCHVWVKVLCENREFESLKQLQNILRVIDVSEEAYNKGLGCPRDAREAIELVKSFPTFEVKHAFVISRESGKKVYEDCQELYKQGRVLYYSSVEDPSADHNYWFAEVVTEIKKGA